MQRPLRAFSRHRNSERTLPSVKFSSRQNDDPVVSRRVILDQLADNVATQRTDAEDGEDLEGDEVWIGGAPTGVSLGVFSPC